MAATDETRFHLKGRRLFFAILLLAFSNLMVVLDLTIANVAVPHISGNLGISPDQGTWVITSYAVAEAITVPLTGWMAQRFGAVRLFSSCLLGFGLFSLACGLSPTLGLLVASRIGQGLSGGMMMPLSQTLLMRIVPAERRTRIIGLWAMTTLVGPIVGPILGGWISDNWSWHWIFFINIPAALICSSGALYLLRSVETDTAKVPIDTMGLMLLIFWIGCLQIMLDIGRDHDWFGDPMIVMLAIGAAVGFLTFIIWELTADHPVVDLRVFRHRGYTFGVVAFGLSYGAFFASVVVIPQWLQTSMGYDATSSGSLTALTGIAALCCAPIASRLTSKVDPRFLIAGGVTWVGIFAAMRCLTWSSSADWWTLAWPQLLQGIGLPFFFVPLTSLTLASVEPSETASAAGLQNFMRTLAIAVSTSLVLTIWGNNQRVSRNEIVSNINPDQVSNSLSGAGFSIEQIRLVLDQLVEKEAIAQAVLHIFAVSAVLLFMTAILLLLAPRPKAGPVDTSGAH